MFRGWEVNLLYLQQILLNRFIVNEIFRAASILLQSDLGIVMYSTVKVLTDTCKTLNCHQWWSIRTTGSILKRTESIELTKLVAEKQTFIYEWTQSSSLYAATRFEYRTTVKCIFILMEEISLFEFVNIYALHSQGSVEFVSICW